MTETYDLILKGGTVVNHEGEGVRDIGIRAGRFAAIGDLSRAAAGEVVDCRSLHILPGIIDSHVHFREPGLTHKEDLETGSLSAVMGGVTAVFEMPNTNPTTTSAEAIADKVKRAHHRMHCDFAFYVGATRENTPDLAELERLPGVEENLRLGRRAVRRGEPLERGAGFALQAESVREDVESRRPLAHGTGEDHEICSVVKRRQDAAQVLVAHDANHDNQTVVFKRLRKR